MANTLEIARASSADQLALAAFLADPTPENESAWSAANLAYVTAWYGEVRQNH